MMKSLYQIAYVSRRAPGVGDDEVVDEIALPSYRRNRNMDITGCLWFDTAYFVQFLEGPSESVLSTYGRICRDRRHGDVREVVSREIGERAFGRFALQVVRDDAMDPVQQLIQSMYGERWVDRSKAEIVGEILQVTDRAMLQLTKSQNWS